MFSKGKTIASTATLFQTPKKGKLIQMTIGKTGKHTKGYYSDM